MSRAVTISGASLNLFINGQKVGFVTSLSYDTDYGKKPIHGIDSPIPQELAPGPQRLTGTMNVYRLKGSGGLEGFGMVPPQPGTSGEGETSAVLNEMYISILLVDRATGFSIFEAERATITRQSWTVGAKGIMTGNVSFEAFYSVNEVQS